ncbi:hypothetical protein [Sphingobium ummariense]|uniref:hypothetical protein n=1 Tax=Sphingobium ummariense TaxID=420994 RepID=UPI00137668DD|nr:hypothetical protein [Sphingobium ummariense]
MTSPIFIQPEQAATFEELKALIDRFNADENLYQSTSAIAAAKAMIEKAHDAGLDSTLYRPLQITVSIHETELQTPERYRSWQPKP